MTLMGGIAKYMVRQKLVDKFGKDILHNSCLWYPSGEWELRALLEGRELRNVLEIGTMFGLSAAVISEYCYHVYTHDIDDHMEKYKVWEFLNRFNISFNSESKVKYDLAFVDGEHWKGGCKKDFEICKDIPLILFHDYNDTHIEVKEFIDGLPAKKTVKGNFVLYENKL